MGVNDLQMAALLYEVILEVRVAKECKKMRAHKKIRGWLKNMA